MDLGAGSTLNNGGSVSYVKNGKTYYKYERGIIRGGAATNYGGHTGGIGVSIAAGATLDNGAVIVGGNGFKPTIAVDGGFGTGGAGVYLAAGGTLTNNDVFVLGGSGGQYPRIYGGNGGNNSGGGDGVVVAAGASFTNGGNIVAGSTYDP